MNHCWGLASRLFCRRTNAPATNGHTHDQGHPPTQVQRRALARGHRAQVFVAAMGASSYTFACATADQSMRSWLCAMARALTFYGGCPQLIVPDNPRALVSGVPLRHQAQRDGARLRPGVDLAGRRIDPHRRLSGGWCGGSCGGWGSGRGGGGGVRRPGCAALRVGRSNDPERHPWPFWLRRVDSARAGLAQRCEDCGVDQIGAEHAGAQTAKPAKPAKTEGPCCFRSAQPSKVAQFSVGANTP
jgi:hypothetical protein